MRLTLRYLLAHMDGILDQETSLQIARKIEESEVAKGLVERIQEVTRQLRLGAPALGDDQGLDANTVAEYLDHTLPHDRVPDFEKVCLDSDVLLSELVACHQILALVLGEPAEVDPESKRRMYQVAYRLAVPGKPAGAADAAAEIDAGSGRRTRPVVPEYLRKRDRRRIGPALALMAIVLLLAVALLALVGPLRPAFLHAPPVASRGGESLAIDPAPAEPQADNQVGNGDAASNMQPLTTPATDAQTVAAPAPAGLAPTSAAATAAAAGSSAQVPPAALPPAQAAALPMQADAGQPLPPTSIPTPAAAGTASATDTPAGPPAAADAVVPAGPAAAEVAPPEVAAAALPEPVAELANADVLLRLNPATSAWGRLPQRATILGNDFLLSLPTYRPRVILTGGVQTEWVEATLARALPVASDGLSGVALRTGRMVFTGGAAGGRLRLSVDKGDGQDGLTGVLTFSEPQSKVAVEVSRALLSGQDPETQPGPQRIDLLVVGGRVLWQEERQGGEPIVISAPVRLTLSDQMREAVPLQQIPPWVEASTLGLLERNASAELRDALLVDRSPNLSLEELARDRRVEVKNLAIASLSAMGEFDPLVSSLADPEQARLWSERIEQLQTAVGRDPLVARYVREAFEKRHGAEGVGLYEMLWKYYNVTSLSRDDAERLVDFLGHESLALRVLSFWNLQRITKLGFSYDPQSPVSKSVQRWREYLKGGFPPPRP